MKKVDKSFCYCEKCGKKLIARMSNGLWHFLYGRKKEMNEETPVQLYISGNIKMMCLRKGCGHWNIFSHLPMTFNKEQGNHESEETQSNLKVSAES